MASFKPEHVSELNFISNPILSPDGSTAVAVHTHIEEDDGIPFYKSQLFLYDLTKGSSKQLTYGAYSDAQPCFSPNGKELAFIAKRSKDAKPQVFILPLDGGEARQLSDIPSGVSKIAWQADGKSLIFISKGESEEPEKIAKRITSLRYKQDGIGFLAEGISNLYTIDSKKGNSKQLTQLKGDVTDFTLSSDTDNLYYLAQENRNSSQSMLCRLKLSSGKSKALLKETGYLANLTLSPDNKTLLFSAPFDWFIFSSPTTLYSLPVKGGAATCLTGDLDAFPSIGGDSRYGNYPNKAIFLDDTRVLLNVNQAGRTALKVFSLSTNSFEDAALHEGDIAITSFAASQDKLVFTQETQQTPGELFVKDAKGLKQLSKLNQKLVSRYKLQTHEEISIKTKDGSELTYWTLSPNKARKDKALVIQVHGGPHTNYGYGFYHEFHMLAAAGYKVVYANPRGSSSFGNDYATCILGKYGTIDADDVLAVARHAKAKHPKAPIHLTGGSYGGFMTNWLVGQTKEFKSAVTQRSICNWSSFFGSSDIGSWFSTVEQKGNPWDDTDSLWTQSPLKYIKNVTTPTLVLHAENDHRCPIEQAEQFYTALKHLGKADTEFVRIPDEGHELSRSGRPDRRIARLKAIIDWFERY